MTPPKLAVDRQVEHDIIVGVRRAERGDDITELTEVLSNTLDMIRSYIAVHGFSPSLREIADDFNCALSVAANRVGTLINRGYLRREPGAARSLVLVDRRTPTVVSDHVHEWLFPGVCRFGECRGAS